MSGSGGRTRGPGMGFGAKLQNQENTNALRRPDSPLWVPAPGRVGLGSPLPEGLLKRSLRSEFTNCLLQPMSSDLMSSPTKLQRISDIPTSKKKWLKKFTDTYILDKNYGEQKLWETKITGQGRMGIMDDSHSDDGQDHPLLPVFPNHKTLPGWGGGSTGFTSGWTRNRPFRRRNVIKFR